MLASPNAKTLHNAFSVSNAAVAHDIRPMETMGKLTEENEGTASFSKPQARHWTACRGLRPRLYSVACYCLLPHRPLRR